MEKLPLVVHVVSNGELAIEFIARAENDANAPSLDFLLLDLNLPKRDGFEVLNRIRGSEKYKNVPVLVITSSDSPIDRSRVAALGAGYFQKPPSYDEFMKLGAVLKKMVEESRV
ncbi:MAG TPA: response regulator [Bryobacteraceae bacterium]|jgi:DNA-binding response OmpR family regulator